jgi:hypothetical protein
MPAILKRLLKPGGPDHHMVFRDFAGVLERLIRRR